MVGSARTVVRLRPGRRCGRGGGSHARRLIASLAVPLVLVLAPAGARAAITEFPVPTPDSAPAGIAAGPDGALWFTESAFSLAPGAIGRITTAGSISETPVPPTGIPTVPAGITPGPDGALWFTQPGQFRGGGLIGRITTSGRGHRVLRRKRARGPRGRSPTGRCGSRIRPTARSSASRPTEGSARSGSGSPSAARPAIAAGPDGALWYTDPGTNVIGRVTTAGAVTTYPLPTPARGPSGITSGPDGALWFTEADAGNRIGRITTAGMPGPSSPSPTPGSRAGRHRRRARRGALVHRGVRQQDRADHHHGSRDRVPGPHARQPAGRHRRRPRRRACGSPRRPATGSGGSAAAPTSMEQCRNGGWRAFPAFKNQGQCVAFVERVAERGPRRVPRSRAA